MGDSPQSNRRQTVIEQERGRDLRSSSSSGVSGPTRKPGVCLMLHPFVHATPSPHDAGVRQVAALSARLAYAMMCATLSWGVLVSTGWLHRLSGRQATRNSHMVLATLTLAFGTIHVLAFLFLTDVNFTVISLF